MHKRFQSQKPPTTSAFTIIELLIVIVVIGILATITIVAYSNIQNRARTAALTSSLSQAATKLKTYDIEIGSYPESLTDINIHSSEAVTYTYHKDNNSNPRSFCITAIKNNLVYKVTDTSQPSPGGCSMHTWPGGVVMTNLITNGDFSQGVAGWDAHNATLSASGGEMTLTSTAQYGSVYRSLPSAGLAPQTKIYAAVTMRALDTAEQFILTDNTSFTTAIAPHTGGGAYERTSGIASLPAGVVPNLITLRFRSNAASGWTPIYVKNVVALDLTATFGAGNEPTKEQMDQILQQFPNSWFSGTVTANTQGIL